MKHTGLGGSSLFSENVRIMPCYREWLTPVFRDMGGSQWTSLEKRNWNSNQPIESWHGVTIEGNSDFGLTLTANLRGSSLACFGGLTILTKLSFAPSKDNMTWTLKECSGPQALAPLAALKRLEELTFKNCKHFSCDLSPINDLPKLELLCVKGCPLITGDINSLPRTLLTLDMTDTENEQHFRDSIPQFKFDRPQCRVKTDTKYAAMDGGWFGGSSRSSTPFSSPRSSSGSRPGSPRARSSDSLQVQSGSPVRGRNGQASILNSERPPK